MLVAAVVVGAGKPLVIVVVVVTVDDGKENAGRVDALVKGGADAVVSG